MCTARKHYRDVAAVLYQAPCWQASAVCRCMSFYRGMLLRRQGMPFPSYSCDDGPPNDVLVAVQSAPVCGVLFAY